MNRSHQVVDFDDLIVYTADLNQRTSHGSTLSFVAYAGVLAGLDVESSWERFMVALESDIEDVQGGTTAEGVHIGVMAGTLDLVQRFYLGALIRDDILYFNPRPVDKLEGASLPIRFRRSPVQVTLQARTLNVAARPAGFKGSVKVGRPRRFGRSKPARARHSRSDRSEEADRILRLIRRQRHVRH